MKKETNIWGNQRVLVKLEKERDLKREFKAPLTFDCFNAKCQGDRVQCAAGHRLPISADGTMSLVAVLRGRTAKFCYTCKDFNGD
jgi:hypothetical protein